MPRRVKRTGAAKETIKIDLSAGEQPKPAGKTVTFPTSTSNTELATRALMRRADEARKDIAKFYDFTIRHETTKAPLSAAPHQRLMFRFVMDFPLCVVRQPVGTGKTFGMAAVGLYYLGQDVTNRGAVVSKAQGQSSKVVRMVSDYITDPHLSAPVNIVFPWLKKTLRSSEQWTQTAITIDRPAGIRDPSLIAIGLDGQIQGSRLSWVVGDDILDSDNTLTTAGRDQIHQRFDNRVLSRLDPVGARAVVTNTPWHREDLTFKLEAVGWPTVSMDIYGNIWFSENVSTDWIMKTGLLRPSKFKDRCWRLVAHDPDPQEQVPLWPDRYSLDTITTIRSTRLPQEFARLFLCQPFDESSMRCQRAWIDEAKRAGRGLLDRIKKIEHGAVVYTGVDLGVGQSSKHDLTSFFTFQMLNDRRRQIVEVDSGRWSGPVITEKVIDKHDRFGSMISVESNTAQDFIRQFAQGKRPDLRVRAHKTGMNKHNLDFGVESVFTELQNGQWIIPCDDNLNSTPEIERWIDECLYYQPPPAHTGDRLMACWIARESSRRGGGGRDPKPRSGSRLSSWSGGGF